MQSVPFVSQRDYAFAGVACGVAATMMLLKYHLRRKRVPSYLELRKALGVHILRTENRDRNAVWGVDTEDVTRYFRQHGISYRATHRNTPMSYTTLTRRLRRCRQPSRNVEMWTHGDSADALRETAARGLVACMG